MRWVIKTLDDEAAAHITAPFTGSAVQRVALSNPGSSSESKKMSRGSFTGQQPTSTRSFTPAQRRAASGLCSRPQHLSAPQRLVHVLA